jgi:hypothetical protein
MILLELKIRMTRNMKVITHLILNKKNMITLKICRKEASETNGQAHLDGIIIMVLWLRCLLMDQ